MGQCLLPRSACEHRAEPSGIDVPSRDERDYVRSPPNRDAAGEQSRGGRGARPFHDELRAAREGAHRVGDLVFGHRLELHAERLHDAQRKGADERRRHAVGERSRGTRDRNRLSGRDRRSHSGSGRELDGDHSHGRPKGADRAGHAGEQSSSAHRNDDDVDVRKILDDLEARGARAGEHDRIVEGVHEDEPARVAHLRELDEEGVSVVVEHDLGGVSANRVDLRTRRVGRHDDHARRIDEARRPRHRLSVVSRRHRDDPRRALGLRKGEDLVERPARLERSGLLEALAFQEEPNVEPLTESARREQRGAVDLPHEAFLRGATSFELDQSGEESISARVVVHSGALVAMSLHPPTRHRAVVAALLAALTLAALAPVLHNDFISYDDEQYVTRNYHVRPGLTAGRVRWALTTDYAANWHPLTWISHMLDVSLFGKNAHGHHLTSLLFHLASTVMLFLVLTTMTGATGRSAFVAALFGVHPLHVESVAWIAERKDVLSTFFFMLTLAAYCRYVAAPSTRRYALVMLTFVAGLMAKPMLVTLPFVLLLLDYWPLARWPERSFKRLLIEKLPLVPFVIASSIATFVAQSRGGAVNSLEIFPLGVRVGNAIVSYGVYLWKTIWPVNLAFFYLHPAGAPSAVAGRSRGGRTHRGHGDRVPRA